MTKLYEVLENYCAEEYALPKNAPRHLFSRTHRRAMNTLFYVDDVPKAAGKMPLKRRVLIIAAIAVLAIMGAAAVVVSHGFRFDKNPVEDEYLMMTQNAAAAPKTIEHECYDPTAPEGWKMLPDSFDTLVERGKLVAHGYVALEDRPGMEKKPIFTTEQFTKNCFEQAIDEESDADVKHITVKNCNGFAFTRNVDEPNSINVVIWDCGDYIHRVSGTVPMKELLTICEGMKDR